MGTQIRGANNGTGTSQIQAGTVSNADIHTSAAIASTKLASWSADRNANSHKLTNLTDPSSAQDAATKAYVDAAVAGLSWKQDVAVATTANITLSGAQTIDGYSAIAGDRVLVKDQTDQKTNGIYVVASGAWTRSTDADTSVELTGAAVYVAQGTAGANNLYTQTTVAPVIATDNIVWVQFSSGASIVAGNGLTKTGNTIDVVSGNTGIVANANDITLTLATGSQLEISSGLRIAAVTSGSGLQGGAGSALALKDFQEVIPGTFNGSNTAFTLSHAPRAASLIVTIGGLVQQPGGVDFTLSGSTVTFVVAPQSTDNPFASYFY